MARLLKIVRISTLLRLQPSLSPFALRSSLQPNRQLSQASMVDTLALVRSLEAQGLPSKQANAITSAVTKVLNGSKQSFVSDGELDKVEMVHEENPSKFNSEIKSSQENQFIMLRSDMNIMKIELKSEIKTVAAGLSAQIETATAGSRAQLEAVKLDIIKYCIGSVVAIASVDLAVLRLGL